MTYYIIPRNPSYIYKYLSFTETNEVPDNKISHSLSHYLSSIKTRITSKEQQWDIYKKYTNPFEYIHSVVPFKKKSVSNYRPISRSFFKMIEIMHTFEIKFPSGIPIRTFHLAEGPGGFIESLCYSRPASMNPDDEYYGMTLISNDADSNVPGWKKTETFLKENSRIQIETGKDKTGNILTFDNFIHVTEKYGSTMDFITGDGGFDFSTDFNQQEMVISKLLFAQIAFALMMQKYKGTFVLKIFDCFLSSTIDLIYLLSGFYEKVHIMKPNTSRYANSEKYIVCSGFLFHGNAEFASYLKDTFFAMTQSVEHVQRYLSIDIPIYFIRKLEEYNSIYGQKQIQNINYTMSIMDNKSKNDKIDILIKTNIHKSIEWCKKHGIELSL